MLQELKGKQVTVYLDISAWGNSYLKGEIIEVNDSWLKLKGKKAVEFVASAMIKRITVHN